MKIKSLYSRFCESDDNLKEAEVDIGKARGLLKQAQAKQPGQEYYPHEAFVHDHEQQKLQLQRDMRLLHREWLDYTT